jgi:hypothetical protein
VHIKPIPALLKLQNELTQRTIRKHFEIGGIDKVRKQLTGLKNAWIVKDDMEYPIGGELPLWMFGFLY